MRRRLRRCSASRRLAAKFLTQTTFGPRLAEIDALGVSLAGAAGGSSEEESIYASWIAEQMAIPPSLHRAYYRTRTNPRLSGARAAVGSVRRLQTKIAPRPRPSQHSPPQAAMDAVAAATVTDR